MGADCSEFLTTITQMGTDGTNRWIDLYLWRSVLSVVDESGDEAQAFVEAEVEVHALDGGAGGSFAQVVEAGHDDGLFGVA